MKLDCFTHNFLGNKIWLEGIELQPSLATDRQQEPFLPSFKKIKNKCLLLGLAPQRCAAPALQGSGLWPTVPLPAFTFAAILPQGSTAISILLAPTSTCSFQGSTVSGILEGSLWPFPHACLSDPSYLCRY